MDRALMERLMESIFKSRRSTLLQLSDNGISLVELITLKWIEHNSVDSEDNVYASELQGKLFVSKAAVSQMLSVLEKRGLIHREINESNRRRMDITLTDEGRKVLAASQDFFAGVLLEIVEKFGEERLCQMIDLIDDFSRLVETVANEKVNEKDHILKE